MTHDLEAAKREEVRLRRRMMEAADAAEQALAFAKLAHEEHAQALERLKSRILNYGSKGPARER